jgi:hypothetical protein
LYGGVHEKIREDPSPSEKKSFTPDKSYKCKAKETLAEFKEEESLSSVAVTGITMKNYCCDFHFHQEGVMISLKRSEKLPTCD